MSDRATSRSSFESSRLLFRPHRPENLHKVREWECDPELRHLGDESVAVPPEEETRAALERWLSGSRADQLHFAIHFAGGAGAEPELIGFAQIVAIDPEHSRCKLGIVLGEKRFWGRGLGAEAIRRLVRYCFEELGVNRIAAETYAFNERAIRALEAAGFRREGVLRENLRRAGGFHDELLYSLLRRERPER